MRRDGRSGKPCRENVDAIKPVINAYKTRANERRAKAAAIQRERYNFLRAHGLCVRCKEAAMDGKSLCAGCYMYDMQRKSGVQFLPKERSEKRQAYCDSMRVRCKQQKRNAKGHFIKEAGDDRTN